MKVFSSYDDYGYEDERLYSVLMDEEELSLFSEYQKEFNSQAQKLIRKKWELQNAKNEGERIANGLEPRKSVDILAERQKIANSGNPNRTRMLKDHMKENLSSENRLTFKINRDRRLQGKSPIKQSTFRGFFDRPQPKPLKQLQKKSGSMISKGSLKAPNYLKKASKFLI